jgi:hypothetical protein
MNGWRHAVEVAPDHAESWYELGDFYYHSGAKEGVLDSRSEARSLFREALRLDSTFAAPLAHLLEMAATDGDTATMLKLEKLYLGHDSLADHIPFIRWRSAIALGDTAKLARLRARMDSLPMASLLRISGTAVLDGVGVEDAEAASRAMIEQSRQGWAGDVARTTRWNVLLNEGRPRDAAAVIRGVSRAAMFQGGYSLINSAVLGIGDTLLASRIVSEHETALSKPEREDPLARSPLLVAACEAALWHASRADLPAARRNAARLAAISKRPAANGYDWGMAPTCMTAVDALIADAATPARVPAILDQLDSLILQRMIPNWNDQSLTLLSAKLRAKHGDLRTALATLRRRAYHASFGTTLLAEFLREEGRLAAQTGDRAGAIRAYRHYLALRFNPEPSVKPEVELVRAELDRLVRAGT